MDSILLFSAKMLESKNWKVSYLLKIQAELRLDCQDRNVGGIQTLW